MIRWTSRKFLLAVVAQLAGFLVLLWPQHQEMIMQLAQSLGALIVILVSTTTYVASEASVDVERARSVDAPQASGS